MYEERREKFSFKSFFLTLLLVLLFIFLMLWLFPNKSYVDKKLKEQNPIIYDIDRLSVLYDEIFANNVSRMKDAAIGYFTNERMPQTVGETKKLTLQQMYDLHLVLKMKDKEGKECDVTKSYVEMTKYTEEYRLKVNLSCGDIEDYIIVYLGCYNYCPNGICEKKVPTPSKTTEKEIKEETKKYYCEYKDGKYYDKNGKVVSKADYEKSCKSPEPTKYYCEYKDGKYYDKNGKVVSKADYEKSCKSPEPTKYYCEYKDGKYYDKEGKVVSKADYEKSCKSPEPTKYYCEYKDGKYYDKEGNVVSKADYEKSCNPEKKYLYEYKLVVPDTTVCPLKWSKWQKKQVKPTKLIQVETKKVNEVIDYKIEEVPTTKTEIVKKQVTEKYIKDYITKLVVVGTRKEKVGTTTKTITERVATGTVEVATNRYGSGSVKPKDTDKVHYKIINPDTKELCSYCKSGTVYYWREYDVETVYKVQERTVEIPVYKTVNVYEEQKVPVWDYRTVEKEEEVTTTVIEEKKVPVYGDVIYYRYKKCIVKPGYSDVKWSESKEDKALLDKGYKLTGNVKEA